MTEEQIIGKSVPRKEGRDKVTGAARYIDDMAMPGMLFGATVRSQIPRGVIKHISFDPQFDWSEFVVVTAQDIPGKNCIALIGDDQPCLADGKVNHPEEPILLLAHADPHLLRKAVDGVSIEYEPLPAIFTIEESERCSEIIWGMDNTLKTFLIAKGDVDHVWAKADYIVEGEYTTGAQEQLYIENNGVIAAFDLEQGITVWGSLQCPYYVHKALMALCNLPAEKIRVVQAETGGAFGGKEDYPSFIAGDVGVLVVEKGSAVEPVRSAVNVSAAVNGIGAGGGAHVDVRAAGGSLLRIVHRGIDAEFLNRLRCRSRQCLPDGQIRRRRGLNYFRGSVGGIRNAGIVHDARGTHRTRGLAIKQIAGVDAIEQKSVAGIALAVGPDRLITESGVGAGAFGQFRIDSGRKNGEAREAAGRQWDVLNLILFEDVAVRRVDRIHQRVGLHFDDRAYLADRQRHVDGCRAIRLHGNRRYLLGLESVMSERQRIRADRKIDEVVAAVGVGLEAAGQLGLVGDDSHVGIRQHASGLVRDRTSDAAECLLRVSMGRNRKLHS